MSNNDWIKLYRKVKESKVWYYTHAQYRVWETILLSVNWDESWARHRGEEVKLEPGQMVTSRQHLVDESRTSKKVVRDTLDKLEKDDMINTDRSNTGTLLTVVNWPKYQENEEQGSNDLGNDEGNTGGSGDGSGGGSSGGTHEEVKEGEEHEEAKQQTKPNGLGDRPDPDDADFSEKQEYLVGILSESEIPETTVWGLVGKWINHYGFEDVADAVEELSMKGKLEGLDKPGYIVGTINNDFEDSSKDYKSLPAPDELEEKQEGYWESVLPDCYADEDYPSMIYAEDVRKIAGMLDGHGEARAVKLLEEYFSEHDDKSELGDWLQEELDQGEKKQPA